MNKLRAAELRSMLRREIAVVDCEIVELQAAIRERHARAIVICELLSLLARP